jgi:hypothetical protein
LAKDIAPTTASFNQFRPKLQQSFSRLAKVDQKDSPQAPTHNQLHFRSDVSEIKLFIHILYAMRSAVCKHSKYPTSAEA